jgi:hypothetical protein
MKNVTITVDEDVARWARIEAAKRETSVSKMVGGMLAEKMRAETAYEAAMDLFLSIQPTVLSDPGKEYPRRNELYDRAGLR